MSFNILSSFHRAFADKCLRVQYKNINFARKQKGESLLQYYLPASSRQREGAVRTIKMN